MADANMKICVQQLNNAVARTPSPNWEKMSDKIGKCFESIIRHKAKAKEAMDKLAPELDALLAQ
jgi:multiple sugar transport system substrate-binding protein